MHILISPTAFKGTLTPTSAAQIMARAAKKSFPGASVKLLPLADGGDGTLEVLSDVLSGKKMTTPVEGPLGKKVKASWSLIERQAGGRMAVIEMARASGLALVKGRNRIMEATSSGTGELIKAALDQKCKRIMIGVGGTACSDGGAGALRALGLRYFDNQSKELSAKPKELKFLSHVDRSRLDPRLKNTRIDVLCDVTNPLLGSHGSAKTFGPQKGATPSQVKSLEKILKNWSRFSKRNVVNKPGSGAAGALAFGLAGFVGAKLTAGTQTVMTTLNWMKEAAKADLIFTGEGRLDKTSFQGKVVGEVIRRRGRAKVIVICGSSSLSSQQTKKAHIERVIRLEEIL